MEAVAEKRKKKIANRLGYSKDETKELGEKLNLLLCNYHVHYQKLRNYHWNVKGHDFFDLHENFEEFYEEAKDNIDDIAERIRVFGRTPISTMKEYLEHSEIEETGTDLEGDAMVEEVLNDFQAIVSFMVEANEAASKIGDYGTIEMINSMINEIEEHHWMMSAFIGKG